MEQAVRSGEFGAAERRLMQTVIVRAGAEVFKALPDCRILHAGNPEPLHGLFAARQLIDVAENQFALPSRVCWIVGIGDLENIHYSRVSNAPMNL